MDLPAPDHLEIRYALYLDKPTFACVLENTSTQLFRYDGGMTSRDLDKNIDALAATRRCWQAGQRNVGKRVPATKCIGVDGPCLKFSLQQLTILELMIESSFG